jgi:hypothetical protein
VTREIASVAMPPRNDCLEAALERNTLAEVHITT